MNEESVRKYVGKKVLIVLKNNFEYTITIPEFAGSSFSATDKFGKKIDIECDFISYISEVQK